MLEPPVFVTSRLVVRLLSQQDVAAVLHYYKENQAFLEPFEPIRPRNFYTKDFWTQQIEKSLIEFGYDRSLRLFIFTRAEPKKIIGTANFTQMVQGVSYSCSLGYSLAQSEQGNGYMVEALQPGIQYLFEGLNLHRINANYMPHNRRSGSVLKKLGFVVEGYARDYLLINGKWEDHILTSLINSNWVDT
ncbi:MAG: ribosomal protein S5-alanine N-acetyltransferase [Myxacorys californica WJT36-NPBG1]|jgi:ribosomal-protein-alanine N-acetyltransferase|nr:ribosomal protein S5-alanine N-acetyltransferase [Myxacorys californica WJT36-NPBG1]